MKIKRFVAPDMRTALRMVREDQGPDAVILSSKKLDHEGFEVVAATDFDESLARHTYLADQTDTRRLPTQISPDLMTSEQKRSKPVEAPKPAPAPAPVKTLVAKQAAADPATVAWRDQGSLADLRRELSSMRELLERQAVRFSEERLRGVAIRSIVLDELLSYGCDGDLARSIATAIPADADRGRARGIMLGLLAKSLVVTRREAIQDGGILALIGPTGVGKTTTIAKLAARYAHHHSARDVVLVTTDTQRVGGREQLATFGRVLGLPVIDIDRTENLAPALERLNDYKLILIDTPGFSQRDVGLATQLGWLRAAGRVRCFLTLPATSQMADIDEVVRKFRCAEPEGCVLTKIDETGCLGSALSVLIRHRLPVAYVTDGQRVPEDIHRAEAHRLVLRLGELKRAGESASERESNHAAA
ncbi:flagellar biosynthesis protein FlhF [Pseudomarimonas arenosa]|uniref:Flagellar biosynthesis protein FlhF n=1 Tax=Pseudomarimonas arenosa TaxID=2774145 RepID=A0AAW3ZJT6_9GAMM|nr:flagellar biosynthesis protein FlhF [Pseudomarimonas arenosa]MBD8524726.1 flagellar biosynthesis protein FlhF [Pseudomarimonas arenosa]